MRKTFDCSLDVKSYEKHDLGVVTIGTPIGSDEYVARHIIEKAGKVDIVLDLVRPLNDAQIALPIHRSFLSVVLFSRIFFTTPPSQNAVPSLALDTQKFQWLDKLLPALPPLASDALAQSRLPLRKQGLGLTEPSDFPRPALIASRFYTAHILARLRRASPVSATLAECEPLFTETLPLQPCLSNTTSPGVRRSFWTGFIANLKNF